MNTRSEANAHLATIFDPIALAHSAIGMRKVDDRDDCASFLLEQLVVIAQTFHPNGWNFSDYAAHLLKLRVIDYIRQTEGRRVWSFSTHTYRRELPIVYSLDGDTDGDGGRLVAALTARSGDPPSDSDPAFARLVEGRDRRRSRDLEELGIPPAA